jgi:hypothetical protein
MPRASGVQGRPRRPISGDFSPCHLSDPCRFQGSSRMALEPPLRRACKDGAPTTHLPIVFCRGQRWRSLANWPDIRDAHPDWPRHSDDRRSLNMSLNVYLMLPSIAIRTTLGAPFDAPVRSLPRLVPASEASFRPVWPKTGMQPRELWEGEQ